MSHNSKLENGAIRTGSVLRIYLRYALKYPWLFVATLIGVLLSSSASVIAPLYLRDIINILSSGSRSSHAFYAILVALGFYASINFAGKIFRRIRSMSLAFMELHVMEKLYNDSFEKLLHHSHEFFISNFTGALTRRVTRFSREFERLLDNVIYNFLPALIFAIGAIGVLMFRNVILGTGLLIWTIVFVYVQYLIQRKLQPMREASSEADSEVTGALSDAVVNHSTITSFATLKYEQKIFSSAISNWYNITRRVWTADQWLEAIQSFLAFVIEIGLLIGSVFLWKKGLITVGDFVLIEVYVLNLVGRLWSLGRDMRQFNISIAEATEMLDIIEMKQEIVDKKNAKELSVSKGGITFNNVQFRYDSGHLVLNDFNLHISPKEKIALVGLSGAGKSTITKLLLRLYDIQKGSINIDGQDISEVTQKSLRENISFVPQEAILFHRSLMENIRYGSANATDAEVFEATEKAHCMEFISQYPEGFKTMVGERGIKLSGGERQRISIARAILKNAPILVLDEATSSLDSESEALIQSALETLMQNKTVIAIAHRLSTVMKMDRIIVMENGNTKLSGTHKELLSHKENLYKKLWEIQAGGFLSK
ncbi:MAG TPA: ABC transporter ATP-binding protein [Candidatus Kaiserbacteria bacterium]|nr:ABC transporter ATP-binding protein [Candidatus Kaiserbacteria bacterium]